MWVTGGLRPPCPVGTSGWLWAGSSHPPNGPSHEPLLLAVIDPAPAPGFVQNYVSNYARASQASRLDQRERTEPATAKP